jgi:hypothetical protein
MDDLVFTKVIKDVMHSQILVSWNITMVYIITMDTKRYLDKHYKTYYFFSPDTIPLRKYIVQVSGGGRKALASTVRSMYMSFLDLNLEDISVAVIYLVDEPKAKCY